MGVQTVLRVLVQGASSSISFRGPSWAVMVSVTHRCSIPSFPQERLVHARIGLAYRICPIRARFCSRNPNWFLHCFFSQHFANPCRQQSTVNFLTRRFQSRIRTDIVRLLSDKQSTVSENWVTGARLVWRGKFGETLFILGTADGAPPLPKRWKRSSCEGNLNLELNWASAQETIHSARSRALSESSCAVRTREFYGNSHG